MTFHIRQEKKKNCSATSFSHGDEVRMKTSRWTSCWCRYYCAESVRFFFYLLYTKSGETERNCWPGAQLYLRLPESRTQQDELEYSSSANIIEKEIPISCYCCDARAVVFFHKSAGSSTYIIVFCCCHLSSSMMEKGRRKWEWIIKKKKEKKKGKGYVSHSCHGSIVPSYPGRPPLFGVKRRVHSKLASIK